MKTFIAQVMDSSKKNYLTIDHHNSAVENEKHFNMFIFADLLVL